MGHWIKVLDTMPTNLSSIPGVSHRIERQHSTLSSDLHMPTMAYTSCSLPHIPNK